MNSIQKGILVQRLVERFKLTEDVARKKLDMKAVQMVLDVLGDEKDATLNEAADFIENEKNRLNGIREELESERAKLDEERKRIEEEKADLEKAKELIENTETEECRDRIRMLYVYNNMILKDSGKSYVTYEKYLDGVTRILTTQINATKGGVQN